MRRVLITISALVALAIGFGLHRSPAGAQAAAEVQAGGGFRISIPDVPGPYCVYGVEKRLREIPAVESVRLLWKEDAIRVVPRAGMALRREAIEAAMERAEYPYAYSVEP